MTKLERQVNGVKSEIDYWEWEKKRAAVESRLGGFPTKRYYRLLFGRDKIGTIIWEREWDSHTEMDAAYDTLLKDPEGQSLARSYTDMLSSEHAELYSVKSAE